MLAGVATRAGVVVVAALATIITLMIAAPVLRAPSTRIFGREIAGRHHDPYTAMEQFARPITLGGVRTQPVTDIAGALLARASGPVAAYNWLVLLSLPLAAIAAYQLARYLGLPHAGATFAALAFAFSPFHLAHAAYHPHIAQVQWLPWYLLALWRCVDRPSTGAVAWLGAATLAVTLSNFYGGLIAATITPVAVFAYWLATRSQYPRPQRRLAITLGSVIAMSLAGLVYVAIAARSLLSDRATLSFPLSDVFLHAARWSSYVTPPVEHPWLGAAALRHWTKAGVTLGLVEHQVYIGFGVMVLAVVALAARATPPPARRAMFAALLAVAATAFVCSLSPEWNAGSFTIPRPSGLLHAIAPMFRSVARFGVVVQLMLALLAGWGVSALLRSGRWRGRVAAALLVALVAIEYVVSPAALSRDVLPTAAHRWLMNQPGNVRALDCTPVSEASAAVPWLTNDRIALVGGRFDDCSEPPADLAQKLAAAGFTHLLIADDTADARVFAAGWVAEGFGPATRIDDVQIFAVMPTRAAIYTEAISGISPREYGRDRSWRWMVTDARWTVVNAATTPRVTTLDVELTAFHHARQLDVHLDGRPVTTITVGVTPAPHSIGPLALTPGAHLLTFHPVDPSQPASSLAPTTDTRPVSVAIGAWHWRD